MSDSDVSKMEEMMAQPYDIELHLRSVQAQVVFLHTELTTLKAEIVRKDVALNDVRENGQLGVHSHWDSTMRSGTGCPICIRQREVATRVRAALSPTAPKENGKV